MTARSRAPSLERMTQPLATLWTAGGALHTGRLNVVADRIELRARGQTLSIPLGSIAHRSIDRSPAMRIRGLPVLRLELADGVVVRIASLERVTDLTDLTHLLETLAA